MTRILLETLLFSSVASNAVLLTFLAGVIRKVMNEMDKSEFKQFVGSLVNHSERSPFMITILNIPVLIAIPYFYLYGFSNWWTTAGLALWLVAGIVSKIYKLPVYKAISKLKNDDDRIQFEDVRKRLNTGNIFQAILNSIATILMILGIH